MELRTDKDGYLIGNQQGYKHYEQFRARNWQIEQNVNSTFKSAAFALIGSACVYRRDSCAGSCPGASKCSKYVPKGG